MADEAERLAALRDRLLSRLAAAVPGLRVNGSRAHRLPGNLNLAFPGMRAETLLAALPDLCLSTGSACSSAAVEPSYVLRAMGIPPDIAAGSLRIGIGRFTSAAEIDTAAAMLIAALVRRSEHQNA